MLLTNDPDYLNLVAPAFIAGRTFATTRTAVNNNAVPAVDTIYLYPYLLRRQIVLTAGMMRSTAGGAGSSVKVGIWANSTVSNRPLGAPLLADNTGVATTGTGEINPALSGTLQPQVLWIGTLWTGTLPTVAAMGISGETAALVGLTGLATAYNGYTFSQAYASGVPTFSEGATFGLSGGSIPVVYFKT